MLEKYLTLPMQLYYDCPDKSNPRINLIKDNAENLYVASEKHDGEASMIIKINNTVHIRSRNISVKTKQYGDYTPKLPHIVEEVQKFPDNTVILAELCLNNGSNRANREAMSTDVGSILRSLKDLAITKQQKYGKIVAVVFDCLMYNNRELINEPYETRMQIILNHFPSEYSITPDYVYHTEFCTQDFKAFFDKVIALQGEGLVCVKKDYPYSPGKRTAWQTLKWKKHTQSYDLKIIGTEDYTQVYTGKQIDKWQFFIDANGNKVKITPPNTHTDYTPVTKGWFYGWKAAIICEYNKNTIRCSSGLTDDDHAQLAEDYMQEYIANGVLFAEVSGMENASKGRLRHPIVIRLRIMN